MKTEILRMKDNQRKNIAILGSTGSIGTQTLDIISEYPQLFKAVLLTARNNWELLAQQARLYLPTRVVIADDNHYGKLREALSDLPIEVLSGSKAIAEAVCDESIDTVVTAMVGYSGLAPTMRAVECGKTIALANKETLVAGGEIIERLKQKSASKLIPVDSEHSAIFQCLVGESAESMDKIILTASGGPFRTKSIDELQHVTVADALRHPNWSMGAKVTIDSASMMNKGFEMIEAHWLFNCPVEQIEIAVHPQSIVHSMVQFVDGSIKAQLGVPDMHIPIRYALGYPTRLPSSKQRLKLEQYRTLEFEAPDMNKFPLLGYAFDAIKQGGNMPCILNAANEIAVKAFLDGRLKFMEMPVLVRRVMDKAQFIKSPDYADIIASNEEARQIATELI
jgi:1-deoxy-D-xylulose-5-phosphate reductoisomerase